MMMMYTTIVSEDFFTRLGNTNLVKVLFKTIDECQSFYQDYYKRNANIIDDLLDYREYKLSIWNTSLEQYLEMCDLSGIKIAFEETFLQPFIDQEVELIERAISNESVTLEYIYKSFQKNVNKNIMKYVL